MTRSRVLLGMILTLAGVVLLLDRIGGIHQTALLLKQWWPLAIVMAGATSEAYESKASAINGIESVKRSAPPNAEIDDETDK